MSGNRDPKDFRTVNCSDCKLVIPYDIGAIHGGRCINCAVQAHHLSKWKGPGYCKFCVSPRKMPGMGHGRNGGADHNDWPSREYHKKCWIKMKKLKEDE